MHTIKINEHYTVGFQPAEQDLKDLAAAGFKSVANLRCDGEEDQPLSPLEEGRIVRELGMEYLHAPVAMDKMSPALIDDVRRKLAKLPTPAYAHCRSGMRCGAVVMMDQAVRKGMTGEQTLAMAAKMGFQCDVPEMKAFVKGYVDDRTDGGCP
jgi:uncharacterized protein (TIGR01244 family)